MNIVTMIPLVASLLYFLLFVFSLRVKRRMNRIFSAYLLAMWLWSFCSFIWHADFPVIGDPRWLQVSVFFAISQGPLLYHFLVAFLGLDTKPIFRVGLWAMYGLLVVVLIGDIHGDLIRATRLERGQFDVQFGSLMYPVWVYGSLGIITCFVLLVRAGLKTTDDPNQRNRLLYLAISITLSIFGIFVNISPQLRPYSFDQLFNLAGAFLMAYAIYRYQLLDLSFVIRRGVAYSVLTTGIAATYLFTIFVFERLARTVFGYGAYLIPILVAVVIAVAFQPLRGRAQTWVDRLFFREKYDAQQMLHRLSRTAASILDLNILSGMLLEEVSTTMHIARACLLLKKQETGEFYLVAQRGLGKDVTNLKLGRNHPLLRWMARERKVLTAHEIDMLPQFKALWGEEKEDLKRLGTELFVPLLAKGDLVGLFTFGPKFSEEAYLQDEKITLTTLANQTAMAIESARLHKAVQEELAERKRAEEEKEKMQAQLLQSQKMEAIGILAGGVAHDFNNLLTTIIGYSGLLLRSLDDHDPLCQNVEQIVKAGERAASLTRQLLVFSRRQPLQTQVLNLNAMAANTEKMLQRLIGEDIELVTVLEPELERVKADPGQIEQVIMNLAVNARDAMPQGGKLTIKTENVTLYEEHCQVIPEARPGKFVRLSVEDTGVGIDKVTIQHIFEPFFSTKKEGTGLGLAVVYGIVTQHEGWINVYSEPGQGSTFKVYLPTFSVEPEEDETEETILLQELQGRGERILVVEDEKDVRAFATTVLGANGYVVFEAASAEETLDIFEREGGDFHLVFSDVVLPGRDAVQLVDQLLARKPALRVLLSSGYTDRKSQWPVIRERGFRFLQKPYDLLDLLRAIREAIEPVID